VREWASFSVASTWVLGMLVLLKSKCISIIVRCKRDRLRERKAIDRVLFSICFIERDIRSRARCIRPIIINKTWLDIAVRRQILPVSSACLACRQWLRQESIESHVSRRVLDFQNHDEIRSSKRQHHWWSVISKIIECSRIDKAH
jgi:hypothetical protein